jgi:hypothetical protein
MSSELAERIDDIKSRGLLLELDGQFLTLAVIRHNEPVNLATSLTTP